MPTDARRWLARCPGCDRPVRTLYIRPDSPRARCRACADLRYRSQSIDPGLQAGLLLGQLRAHLGGPRYRDLRLPFPPRPSGMHRRTYTGHFRAAETLANVAFGPEARSSSEKRLARLRRQMERSEERVKAILGGDLKGQILCRLGPPKKAK